jgi:Uma2 family endonuclease
MTLLIDDKLSHEPKPKRITYKQYLATAPDGEHSEWVNGEVIPMAPISGEHTFIDGFLLSLMRTYVNHKQLGFVMHEPFQMKTGPDLPGRSPDILFVAKTNSKRIKKNHLQGPADVVVEIISPGSQARDRGEKFFEYEKGGVREYWLIDPERKQAEFYLRDSKGIFQLTPIGKDGIFTSKIISGFWIKPAWLFQHPLPSEWSVMKQWNLG